MKKLLILLLACTIFGCNKEKDPVTQEIVYGKNVFNTTVDGIEREYLVHVPQGYDGETTLPVVIMLHGTSGDGEKMYNISGWKEEGEAENIITVFPSSLKPCIIDDGTVKSITKWNSQPSEWSYCPNETPADDIKFFRVMLDEIIAKYSIDERRIYLVGFSNGGQMAAKCAIYLSDRLAAIVENAASFYSDTIYNPLRRIPTSFQLGNKDYGPGVDGPEVPLSKIDSVLISQRVSRTKNTHINSFNLSPAYTISGDTTTAILANFPAADGVQDLSFNFVFVKGLGHVYPNGSNHWMHGAQLHWAWLKQFTLP